jgi:hypothetical protein
LKNHWIQTATSFNSLNASTSERVRVERPVKIRIKWKESDRVIEMKRKRKRKESSGVVGGKHQLASNGK